MSPIGTGKKPASGVSADTEFYNPPGSPPANEKTSGTQQHVEEAAGFDALSNARASGAQQSPVAFAATAKAPRIPETNSAIAGESQGLEPTVLESSAKPPQIPKHLNSAAVVEDASPKAEPTRASAGWVAVTPLVMSAPSLAQGIEDDTLVALVDLHENAIAKDLALRYGLTEAEAAAITLYTQVNYFTAINDLFRRMPPDIGHVEMEAKLLEISSADRDISKLAATTLQGMLKLPPAHSDLDFCPGLGRMVNLRDELDQYQPGQIVHAPTLLSTTLSTDELTEGRWWHHKGQVLVIHQKLNGNGRDISAFSRYKNEKEICFLPGTRFEVRYRSESTAVPPGFNQVMGKRVPASQDDNLFPQKIFIVLYEI